MIDEITDEIIQQVNEHVDLPLLTEDQEEILLKIIMAVLIKKLPVI